MADRRLLIFNFVLCTKKQSAAFIRVRSKPVCVESEAEEEDICCITVDYDIQSHNAAVSEKTAMVEVENVNNFGQLH